ncbi:MAG: hypothetical protein ABIF85_03065 [Nanoarchaeota archaeon]|nr:hypothetical protein [Nanoarchaeota archaeon]MBU4300240.1 hypothetical protein [Nanoarchaeota archaeon]MBU4451626.1 hypothetical protein [Nanoarchaeota archaeon]MCG2723148.1 hypothetical protein [archaeon]
MKIHLRTIGFSSFFIALHTLYCNKKCNKKISAHNKDWYGGMCDDCFNKEYFPDKSL